MSVGVARRFVLRFPFHNLTGTCSCKGDTGPTLDPTDLALALEAIAVDEPRPWFDAAMGLIGIEPDLSASPSE